MAHPPYPPPGSFPANPALGDTYTHDGTVFVWSSSPQGWIRKVTQRSDTYPVWGGQITKTGA